MAIKPTINRMLDRSTARQLGIIFIELYKQGLRHACKADDEGLVREHIEKITPPKMFGYVGEVRESFTYWENRMIDIAEDNKFRNPIVEYFSRLGKYGRSYLSVALVIAKDFYVRGLEDYLRYPDETRIPQLDKYQYLWWGEKKIRKIDKYHLRTYVQDRCDDHIAMIREGFEDIVAESQYNLFKTTFSLAIAVRTGKYNKPFI